MHLHGTCSVQLCAPSSAPEAGGHQPACAEHAAISLQGAAPTSAMMQPTAILKVSCLLSPAQAERGRLKRLQLGPPTDRVSTSPAEQPTVAHFNSPSSTADSTSSPTILISPSTVVVTAEVRLISVLWVCSGQQ